jgi:hypothetical protein
MSKEEIEAGRSYDRIAKETYFETDRDLDVRPHRKEPAATNPGQLGGWTKLRNWFTSL